MMVLPVLTVLAVLESTLVFALVLRVLQITARK